MNAEQTFRPGNIVRIYANKKYLYSDIEDFEYYFLILNTNITGRKMYFGAIEITNKFVLLLEQFVWLDIVDRLELFEVISEV